MEIAPHPARDTPAPPDEEAQQLRALGRLVELGMELAEVIQRLAVTAAGTDPTGPTVGNLAVKFTLVARSVGQTAALAARMRNERKTANQPRVELDRRRRAAARAEEYRRKDKIRSTVERAVRAYAPPADIENRLMQLDDRLEDTDVQPDIDIGRLGAIVVKLCDEFGVKASFRGWTDQECGFVVSLKPDGCPEEGDFSLADPPPGPTLTEIVMAEAAARRAETAAEMAHGGGPEAEALQQGGPEAEATLESEPETEANRKGGPEAESAREGEPGARPARSPEPGAHQIDPSPD